MAFIDTSGQNDISIGEKTNTEKVVSNVIPLNGEAFVKPNSLLKSPYLFETNGNESTLSRDSIKLTIINYPFIKHYEAQLQINGICYKPSETVFIARTMNSLLSYIRIEARTEKFQQFVGVIEKNRFIKALDKWYPLIQ